ncbi:MAG: DUF3015 family protein [Nitrospiraceae bacterium]|nr:DUF3015 family protein [Nitrospiraceae bacterium]
MRALPSRITTCLSTLCVPLLFAACSFKATFKETTDTTSNITGTTSGRTWWNEDGILKPEHKIAAFAAYSHENLETDLARGRGEYLASLETLLDMPNPGQFSPNAQVSYETGRAAGDRSPDQLVHRFREQGATH